MALDPRTPVLVGVAAIDQRLEDPSGSLESLELMVAALEAAADDAGSHGILAEADSIRVPRGFWQYSDPGRLVAERVGASRARTVLSEIGVLQQTLLSNACCAIAAGDETVALVTGAEAKHRELRSRITGVEISDTPQVDVEPAAAVRVWREQHERAIVDEFVELLSIPNVSRDRKNIVRNAEWIVKAFGSLRTRRAYEPRRVGS